MPERVEPPAEHRGVSEEIAGACALLRAWGWKLTPPKPVRGQGGIWKCPGCGRTWDSSGVIVAKGDNTDCSASPIFYPATAIPPEPTDAS